MARLRDTFEDPLLIRTQAGMELTHRAAELEEPLNRWIAQTDALLLNEAFDPSKIERRFRIAANDFGTSVAVARALELVCKLAPGAIVDVVPFTEVSPRKLVSGDVDLIVSGLEADETAVFSRDLFEMTASCLMGCDHPLASLAEHELTMDQLLAFPHVTVLIGEDGHDRVALKLAEHAGQRRLLATSPFFHSACQMLPGTDALHLLPTPFADVMAHDPRFVVKGASCIKPTSTYKVFWHERSRKDAAVTWLVDLLEEACRPLAA